MSVVDHMLRNEHGKSQIGNHGSKGLGVMKRKWRGKRGLRLTLGIVFFRYYSSTFTWVEWGSQIQGPSGWKIKWPAEAIPNRPRKRGSGWGIVSVHLRSPMARIWPKRETIIKIHN